MPLRRHKKNSDEIDAIERQKAELQAQIDALQSFIQEAPEKLQQQQIDRMTTLPAPEELQQRRREKDLHERLTKGEVKNERRHQARSAILFILLVLALISLAGWILNVVQSY